MDPKQRSAWEVLSHALSNVLVVRWMAWFFGKTRKSIQIRIPNMGGHSPRKHVCCGSRDSSRFDILAQGSLSKDALRHLLNMTLQVWGRWARCMLKMGGTWVEHGCIMPCMRLTLAKSFLILFGSFWHPEVVGKGGFPST